MEFDKRTVPTDRQGLIEEIQGDTKRIRESVRRAYRQAGATILVLAPTLWYTLGFIGTHMSNADSIIYLFSVAGVLAFMIISALRGRKFMHIVIKNIPNWMGQPMLSVSLLITGISFGIFATAIGIVGRWRILTMPLFFVCYSFTFMCFIPYAMMALGKSNLNWESVKKALGNIRENQKRSYAFPTIFSACYLLALVDLFYERSELLSLADLQGMLLLLASMALLYWLVIAVSATILFITYEDAVKDILSKATSDPTLGTKEIRDAFIGLAEKGPLVEARKEKKRSGPRD